MIFYTEPMMRNYVNSLPESKTFYIASYGFKKGLYNVPKHAKLLIGLPYFPDCTPDCPHCKQRREKNKESIISALTNYNYKLIDNIHLKLLIIDNIAIIGSRNLTGSQYEDLSIGVEDPKMINALKEHFEYLWDKCKNLKVVVESEILNP
jgi:phosphatidylserine/phosphatidylglycerophosphate/cardiolipin synthase-like enzyme